MTSPQKLVEAIHELPLSPSPLIVLKDKSFKESKIIGDLQVTQLSDNQGQVVGVAKRFNDKNEEIEYFGFTYTLRKIQVANKAEAEWKIIAGVIHEAEPLSK